MFTLTKRGEACWLRFMMRLINSKPRQNNAFPCFVRVLCEFEIPAKPNILAFNLTAPAFGRRWSAVRLLQNLCD